MPVTIASDLGEPPQVAQRITTLLMELIGPDDGVSPLSARGRRRVRIEQMLRAGARVDAALELIALQIPGWSLRRLDYDGGEWHCALSRRRELPDWLDGCAEASNTDIALAILHAAVEAHRLDDCPAVSGRRPTCEAEPLVETMCCDEF